MKRYAVLILLPLMHCIQEKDIVYQTDVKCYEEAYISQEIDIGHTLKAYTPTKHYELGILVKIKASKYHIVSSYSKYRSESNKVGTNYPSVIVPIYGRCTEFSRL